MAVFFSSAIVTLLDIKCSTVFLIIMWEGEKDGREISIIKACLSGFHNNSDTVCIITAVKKLHSLI